MTRYLPLFFLAALTACAPKGDNAITVSPTPLDIQADSTGRAQAQVTFSVPRQAVSRRARLVITPTLLAANGQSEEMEPLVVDASIYNKKKLRRMALEGYQDPYARQARLMGPDKVLSLPYTLTAQLPSGVDAKVDAVVTEDGCGACTGLATLPVARIRGYVMPVPVVKPEPVKEKKAKIIRRPKRKVRQKIEHGEGVARLEFVINLYDIRPAMGRNAQELQHMVDDLRPILEDTTAIIHSITISGMASVDGPLKFNTTLAANRAKSAREWLCTTLGLCDEQRALISYDSKPEGWEPVIAAMEADNHPYAAKVRQCVDKYKGQSDDIPEALIRRMPCWKDIREKYLQKDRRVTYTYTYSHKGVTEEYDDYDDMEETVVYE